MSGDAPEARFGLPQLERWHRNLVGGLFAAYVVELVLHNAGAPIYAWLPWYPFGQGFAPWQPLTRFLVQGADRGAVINVLVALLVMFFLLPALGRVLENRRIVEGVLAGAIGGTILPLALDATGLLQSPPMLGWTSLVLVLPALYGLAAPDQDVLLLVFPAKARLFLWGALVIALLYLLVEQSLDTFEGLGVWLGVFGWWHALGPGARRRKLQHEARDIVSELRRFEVIEGGKDRPQGRQGPSDDWVH